MSIRDEALAATVRNALAQDKRVGGQTIMVRAAEGEIFLKGIVDTEEQKDVALMVIQGVPGVRHISLDELAVREEQERA